jgi:hypothetical protein
MRTKVFLIILLSFLLVITTNSLGNLVGDQLVKHSAKSIGEQVFGDELKHIQSSELRELAMSPQYLEKFSTAKRDAAKQYKPYYIASFAIQTLLILGIGFVCTHTLVWLIKKSH